MGAINPIVEARYYHKEGDIYVCDLCPHRCRIPVGGIGRCIARKGEENMLSAYNYGRVSSIAVDPIEKKPLYHFYPKSKIFSIGGIGCNMSCKNCQNYSISISVIGKKRTTYETPEEIISLCRREKLDAIAFTYNEPFIWFEYIMDIMTCDPDLKYVIVSNGLINEEPLKEICKHADAMNIDIKGFTDEFYMKVCGAHLDDVLRSTKIIFKEKVHLELTYLVIPGYNDSEDEIRKFSLWVRNELSENVPVHFSRFHPDFEMMDIPMTPVETILACRDIADSCGLNYVYVGNILSDDGSDTYCPECGTAVIKRLGYLVDIVALDGCRCACCKNRLPIIR
ncbi:MAG: AmmeMemoRadiSam system radical SAM enzyme [Candidatus Methanomethylophilaceae archaeon]|nr:AmmeMemoRadiSam system radical SAM enzyme [Candidatus Methanomethylophilaceae archaeon]MDD3379097.1 AmmeMemoRadiSam system radical SAM enzyme [Candidatus Methanomethylophilaceae archaeon]MDY0224528.1 AmmeMemoRadiSam system radical SAM enzyme [Candidatus Methanomethylophilaceae archaeon]